MLRITTHAIIKYIICQVTNKVFRYNNLERPSNDSANSRKQRGRAHCAAAQSLTMRGNTDLELARRGIAPSNVFLEIVNPSHSRLPFRHVLPEMQSGVPTRVYA